MRVTQFGGRNFFECPSQAPEVGKDFATPGTESDPTPIPYHASRVEIVAHSTRTDFSIAQPSPSQSKPGAASGSVLSEQTRLSNSKPVKKTECGVGEVAMPDGSCFINDFPKYNEAKQQEKLRQQALVDAMNAKNRAEEEQVRQKQALQDAEEKQRLEDYWAKLQNPSYLQSAPQGSPAQGNTGPTQPSPAQQALDKEVDEKAPCGLRCRLNLAINTVAQPIVGAVKSAGDYLQSALGSPLGSSVCSPQSANYQDCSVNVVAARSWFSGLGGLIGSLKGAPGSLDIIQKQGDVGMGVDK